MSEYHSSEDLEKMWQDAYKQGCESMLEKVRDIMIFHQEDLSGYFTISQDE